MKVRSTKNWLIHSTKWRLICLSVSSGGVGISLVSVQLNLIEGDWIFVGVQSVMFTINLLLFIYTVKKLRDLLMPVFTLAATMYDAGKK